MEWNITYVEVSSTELIPFCVNAVKRLYRDLLKFESDFVTDIIVLDEAQTEIVVDELMATMAKCFIAFFKGQAIGMLTVDKEAPLTIAGLYVSPSFRSQGVGEALVELLQASVPGESLSVKCFSGNFRTLKFYERIGFAFTEREFIMLGVRTRSSD